MIRFSFLALILLAAGPASAQQTWHGLPPPAAVPEPPLRSSDTPHMRLGSMLALKFANPEYAAALKVRGKIPNSFDMAEEQWVRKARSVLSQARRAPAGIRVLTIPRAQLAPVLDGKATPEEWKGALRLPLEPASGGAAVLLLAHEGLLYLAAHAPSDRTEEGFDQFRFWFHIDLSPYLMNERIFIAGKGWLAQLRDAWLPRENAPVVDAPARGTLQLMSDWNIFERTRGATRVEGYRQYELAADLAEIGVFPGVPFPAFFEIEGDPVLDAARKFKARTILGTAGSAAAPLWLHVTP